MKQCVSHWASMQVSLTVDHPQKVLLMGDAQDFGTCKAAKKNGEPCSQIVNLVRHRDTRSFSRTLVSSHRRRSCACCPPAVRVPVLPVSRQRAVQEDELQEGRAAVVVLRQGTQQGEGRWRPQGASVSGRLPLRGRVLAGLRRLAVSLLSNADHYCILLTWQNNLWFLTSGLGTACGYIDLEIDLYLTDSKGPD